MKRIYLLIIAMVSCMTTLWADNTPTAPEHASAACEWLQKMTGLPSHFCACQEDSKKFSFPLDTYLTETVWYNATLGDIKQGITAYLYADCEVQVEIYISCSFSSASYSYTLSPNQTRDINADAIEKKLESAGVEGISDNTVVYLKIYPVGGTGGRVICMPYNQGFHSTCSDCLAIFPEMTIISSHADDVFYLDPAYIPTDRGLAVSWQGSDATPCHLRITRATCDGELLAEADIAAEPYDISINLLERARVDGERLYFHFSHDASAVGRICLLEYEIKTPTALPDIATTIEAQIVIDRTGMMYIRRGNERYTILGNKL